jgi:hypothetical protein
MEAGLHGVTSVKEELAVGGPQIEEGPKTISRVKAPQKIRSLCPREIVLGQPRFGVSRARPP